VYDQVEQQGIKTWSFYRYSLTMEYEEKPPLAPPLIVINLIWRTIKYPFDSNGDGIRFHLYEKLLFFISCCVSHIYASLFNKIATDSKKRTVSSCVLFTFVNVQRKICQY